MGWGDWFCHFYVSQNSGIILSTIHELTFFLTSSAALCKQFMSLVDTDMSKYQNVS